MPDGTTPPPLVLDPRDPTATARVLIANKYTRKKVRTLYRHRGISYAWRGTSYIEIADDEHRAAIRTMLEEAHREGRNGREPFKPTRANVEEVLAALRDLTYLQEQIEPPSWLEPGVDIDPANIIACANSLLDVKSRKLVLHNPTFFNLNALDFAYDPAAPPPKEWLTFLRTVWCDDTEAIETLQDLFGLCLTPETRHQKLFMLVGPKRCGKGTIGRILRALIGHANCCSPTLAGLGTNFGLEPLIGKRLAIISDARLSGRADQAVIAERLLSISGEDALTVDRKFKPAWTGMLRTRFVILTNELPRIADASGALASRFIVLTLKNSFFGREDLGLTDRLLAELPSILNWSLDGLGRLRKRRHFRQPQSSAAAITDLEDLASPIKAFLRDRCNIGPGHNVAVEHLFEGWKVWCASQNRDHPGNAQSFGRDLRTALPDLKIIQPRQEDGGRTRLYDGVGLK
jgi:putative DNA primase/helicase